MTRFDVRVARLALALGAAGFIGGCSATSVRPVAVIPPVPVVHAVAAPAPALPPWLLHLPGIGGKRAIDVAMTRGFQRGGFNGDLEIYDWTEHDAGLHALIAYDRNHKEARRIAAMITERFDRDPSAPIYVTSHSGGGGLAVWALEYLPERVKITTLVMMSPALSPKYDLTAALRHVSGKVYVFSSLGDTLVLGTGCTMLGTIDGVKTAAAGLGGFVRPATGDAGQYAKLVPMPYNPAWVQYDDVGNHVGGMTQSFGQEVLAPLVLSGKLPSANGASVSVRPSQAMQ
jgi:hypothetical protein